MSGSDAAGAGTAAPVVLLDCDPGIDDAMAIADLLARRAFAEVELAGIVATAGNASGPDTVAAALGWLDLGERTDARAGRTGLPQVPVFPGADGPLDVPHPTTPETHGPRGTGYAHLPELRRAPSEMDGVTAWSSLSRAHSGRLHAVVTGPASTLARALRADPGIVGRLASLTIMGGAFRGHPGNTTAVAEWNCHSDPEAAQVVCEAFGPRAGGVDGASGAEAGTGAGTGTGTHLSPVFPRWCGQDVTDGAILQPARLTALLAETGGAPVTRALAAALRFYFEFHESMGEGYEAKVHDPAVVALALEPGDGRWAPARVDVACAGALTRGQTVAEFRAERWTGGPFGSGARNADVLLGVPGGAASLVEAWAARHARWVGGPGPALG
ncbi:nucleoside hydrolase [Dietzia sp.]|uniref:nucleoside hydrolase n=1 Tax=Dietzia sp. TaxID=1871616 RepID=UPI002FDA88FF